MRTPPRAFEDVRSTLLRIPAADAYPLAATVYEPAGPVAIAARAVVVAGATGVRRGFYDPFARHLASNGLRVVTFDYRGIGDSRPPRLRGFRASARDWGALDIEGMLGWTASRFPAAPLGIVGHSIGGQLLGTAPSIGRVDRTVMVAVQHGYWRHYGAAERAGLIALSWLLVPVLVRAVGYFPSSWFRMGENLPRGVAEQWSGWFREPDYLVGRRNGVSRDGFMRVRGAMRVYQIDDDAYAPPAATEALLALYGGAAIERVRVTPAALGVPAVGHFGFFRRGVGEGAWPEVVGYLAGRDQENA